MRNILFIPVFLTLAAMTPMSPSLDDATRLALKAALVENGMTEVETSSVFVALLNALNIGDQGRSIEYREPYAQLPDVDVTTMLADKSCMKAAISAWRKGSDARLHIDGTFCRT